MDKNKAYDSFLKTLRIAITNCSVYSRGHPFFRKSIEDLRVKINEIFSILSPLKIGVAPTYLFIGDERLEKKKLYHEIADFFHRRKVKDIEIREGVTIDELITFLATANLSSKDILRRGGLEDILKTEKAAHITVSNLDYSQLLGEEGEEYKDVWLYMLRRSFDQGDTDQIKKLSDNFIKALGKFDIKGLLGDEEIESIVGKLLAYLKDKDKDRFSGCVKGLMSSAIKSKYVSKEGEAATIKVFLNSLSGEDLSDMLLQHLQDKRAVDSLNFKLFSQLINSDKHQEVASSLAHKLEKAEWLKSNPKVIEKIKELFFIPDDPFVSKAYRHSLNSLLESISLGEGISFDYKRLEENYRLILLELFVAEFEQEPLELVLNNIFEEIRKALKNNDVEYIKTFIEALEKKRREYPLLESAFRDADKSVSRFIENIILTQDIPLDFEYLTDLVSEASSDYSVYIKRMFSKANVDPHVLKLFFKFFFQKTDVFYQELSRRISNVTFIKGLIKSLKKLEPVRSLGILTYLFPLSNDFIKLEILKAMHDFNLCDENFLFTLLQKGDYNQRKYAFLILGKNSKTRDMAARILLLIPNPLGFKGKFIQENLKIINAAPFEEAKKYLNKLAGYKFFWNIQIRRKAKEVLKGL